MSSDRLRRNFFLRQWRLHPRLLLAVLLAAVTAALLPGDLRGSTRAILAMDVGGMVFLLLAWIMMARSTADHMRWRARLQDEGVPVLLLLTVGAALYSLAAIAAELHGLKELSDDAVLRRLVLAGGTLICSWLVTHTMFALHYAHDFYVAAGDGPAIAGGLQFPDCTTPDYGDFLYFSFVIGMTCQTSDVQISGRRMRRLCLAQGVLSFFFNTVILALCINIAAGLL